MSYKAAIDRKIIGAFLGTIVEYYDYSLYAFSASIIAKQFFPYGDNLTNLTKVFGIYAFAYLAKPLGSLIFGRIGDLYGRKFALNITIIGIAVPTLIIGCLPNYATIGYWSTLILSICRFAQNIFAAGEYDGAAIYTIEHLGKNKHYSASALARSAGVAGLLLGTSVTNFFNSHLFGEFGWRIPFLLSLPLAFVSLYYRRFMNETPDFTHTQYSRRSLLELIKSQWPWILVIIFLAGSFGATYQIAIIFMRQYLPIVVPAASFIMNSFSITLVIAFGTAILISGTLADRFGKMIVIKAATIASLMACSLLAIAIRYQMLNLAIAASLFLSIAVAPFNALAHGIVIKIFAVNERYRAIGLGHAIGSMLMSGTANYICSVLIKDYNLILFPLIYVSIFVVLSYYLIKNFSKSYAQK